MYQIVEYLTLDLPVHTMAIVSTFSPFFFPKYVHISPKNVTQSFMY